MWSLVKDISIQAQFLANCGGSGSRRAGRPRRAREPSAPALELLPHEGRAAGQGCELLVAHVARRPAEAAVGVDRELLGRADGEDPADTLRDVLRCILGEALHIDHTRAELAPIAVSLPEVELGHLAAREPQPEPVGPRFQDPGEARLARPLEARTSERSAKTNAIIAPPPEALPGYVRQARHLLPGAASPPGLA